MILFQETIILCIITLIGLLIKDMDDDKRDLIANLIISIAVFGIITGIIFSLWECGKEIYFKCLKKSKDKVVPKIIIPDDDIKIIKSVNYIDESKDYLGLQAKAERVPWNSENHSAMQSFAYDWLNINERQEG